MGQRRFLQQNRTGPGQDRQSNVEEGVAEIMPRVPVREVHMNLGENLAELWTR